MGVVPCNTCHATRSQVRLGGQWPPPAWHSNSCKALKPISAWCKAMCHALQVWLPPTLACVVNTWANVVLLCWPTHGEGCKKLWVEGGSGSLEGRGGGWPPPPMVGGFHASFPCERFRSRWLDIYQVRLLPIHEELGHATFTNRFTSP